MGYHKAKNAPKCFATTDVSESVSQGLSIVFEQLLGRNSALRSLLLVFIHSAEGSEDLICIVFDNMWKYESLCSVAFVAGSMGVALVSVIGVF